MTTTKQTICRGIQNIYFYLYILESENVTTFFPVPVSFFFNINHPHLLSIY